MGYVNPLEGKPYTYHLSPQLKYIEDGNFFQEFRCEKTPRRRGQTAKPFPAVCSENWNGFKRPWTMVNLEVKFVNFIVYVTFEGGEMCRVHFFNLVGGQIC